MRNSPNFWCINTRVEIMVERKATSGLSILIILIILGISIFGYFYLVRSPDDIAILEMPSWVQIGAEATYDQRAILSPDNLDSYVVTAKWEIVKIYLESFDLEYMDESGIRVTNYELDGLGGFYVFLFGLEPGRVENYFVKEDIIDFLDFGRLRVYHMTLETDSAVWSGLYEGDTGILLELDVRGKGTFYVGEVMGLFTQLRETNIRFKTQ